MFVIFRIKIKIYYGKVVIEISSSNNNINEREGKERRLYNRIFISAMILIFIAIILISIPGFVPIPDFGTGEYAIYMEIKNLLGNIWRLLINIAIALIAFTLFLGAFRLKDLSEHAKRGMYIAFGLVMIGFILNLAYSRLFGY